MLMGVLRLDVPVVPDADTARSWAGQELSDPIYHEQQTLLARLLTWIEKTVSDAAQAAQHLDWRMASIMLAAVIVVGAGIAVLVTGPIRRSRAASQGSDIFADTTLSAAEHRRAADLATDRADWHEAVLERFRAIVRSLEERVIIDERPGRTAHEAATDSAAALPGLAVELRRASTVFDDVCYGSGRATRETDAALRFLDHEIQTAEPVRTTVPVPA
jgi:hypothetical protein